MSLLETSEIGMISPQIFSSSSYLIHSSRSEDLSSVGVEEASKTVPRIPEKEELREEIAESSPCVTTEYSLISTDLFVGAGGRGDLDLDLDLDLDVSSKKALDNLHEIVFLILDQGGKGVEREPQGLIFRRKVNIAITTLLVAVISIALAYLSWRMNAHSLLT